MFKGCHFPSEIILETIRYYHAYKLSYREIEEIQCERGVQIDHATIHRWVIKFTPVLEHNLRYKKKPVSRSWRMDETYIKIKGTWFYYYRAVDKFGDVIDYYLSLKRDEQSAKAFLNKAIAQNGLPEKIVIDGSQSNHAAIDAMNIQLWLTGFFMLSLIVDSCSCHVRDRTQIKAFLTQLVLISPKFDCLYNVTFSCRTSCV